MEKQFNENELAYYFDGVKLARVVYEIKDGVLTILSTVVDPSLRGQGIAAKLMDDVEKYALEKQLKIKAVCSYAVKYFSMGEHPSYLG